MYFLYLVLTFTPHYIITDKGLFAQFAHGQSHVFTFSQIDTCTCRGIQKYCTKNSSIWGSLA